ncbi:MAG: thioredoxin domain-containing protein, partial [Candidatus Methanomethylicaceae archaeon]
MIIIDLNKENWNSEVIKSKMLTLVYFWHEGCPWCRLFNPIFEKIAQEYEGKLKFTKFNIFANESNAELA